MPRVKATRTELVSDFDLGNYRRVAKGHNAKSTLHTFAEAQVRARLNSLLTVLAEFLEQLTAEGRQRAADRIREQEFVSTEAGWTWATITLKPDLLAAWGEELGSALLPFAASFHDFSTLMGAEYANRKAGDNNRARVVASRLDDYKGLAQFSLQKIVVGALAWEMFS